MKSIEKQISELFEEYGEEVKEKINQIAEEVADETVAELKKTSPVAKVKGGKYRRGWKKSKEVSLNGNYTFKVHNTQYRLTHLLENGHLTRDGQTRYKGVKHIQPAEEKAVNSFLRKVEEKL